MIQWHRFVQPVSSAFDRQPKSSMVLVDGCLLVNCGGDGDVLVGVSGDERHVCVRLNGESHQYERALLRRVVVNGATGKMGAETVAAIGREAGLKLVGATCHRERGNSLAVPGGAHVPLSTNLEDLLARILKGGALPFQDGKRVRFYSDVLEDRVVLINVVFTSCDDACPLITRKLNEVRAKLGERFGSEVHFISISVDPERDSPQALKKFAAAQGADAAGWTFLTGAKADVDRVLARLGQLTAADYEDDVAKDPRIDKLRAKTVCVEDKKFTRDYHEPKKRSIANALTVEFADGRKLKEIVVEYPIGHKRRRKEGMPVLVEKFKTNLARRFPVKQQKAILELCMDEKKLAAAPVNEFVDLFVI